MILIADDDDLLRETIASIIEIRSSKKFQFVFAKDGQDALNKVLSSENDFSTLITDFNMPYMTGGELVRELLQREITIPRIIIISGQFQNEAELNDVLVNNPHIVFLQKPFTPNQLLELLK